MPDTLHRSFLLLSVSAALMAALLAFLPAAGHDQLWFLLMARRWLDGATLYGPEIFDSNAPMVVWLSAIPVLLGRLTHLPATALAKAAVLVLSSLVALFSGSLLPRAWRSVTRSEWPALAFAWIALFLVVPARDLGQRDALAAFLVLPYVLCAARGAIGRLRWSERSLAAVLAALACCLKPHCVLIPIAVECAVLALARRFFPLPRAALRRPEPLILLACGLLYLLAIHRFAPLYFTEALPIARRTYWAIGHLSFIDLLWQAIELTLLAALTLALALRSGSPVTQLLLAAGLGGFVAYLLQGTGWYYQQLPAISLFGAALVLRLLDLQRMHSRTPPSWTVPALGALCLLAVALTSHFTGYPFTPDRAFAVTSPDPGFFSALPPGTPVAILTTSVDEAMMPIERFHLTWAQRTDNLWLLPAILRREDPSPSPLAALRLTPAETASLDALQHRWMVEDLTRWQPNLILVERCQDATVHCQVLEGRHDNLLAWFRRDPAFAALWTRYRFTGTRDRFDAYTLAAR